VVGACMPHCLPVNECNQGRAVQQFVVRGLPKDSAMDGNGLLVYNVNVAGPHAIKQLEEVCDQ